MKSLLFWDIAQRLWVFSLALTWLQGPDYCPLTGHNPWSLLTYLPDTTP
jgi:hypothetical protein